LEFASEVFSFPQEKIIVPLISAPKDTAYEFTGRLVKAIDLQSKCGDISFAVIHKFQVLHTTFPRYKKKFVLIIPPCPEEEGKSAQHVVIYCDSYRSSPVPGRDETIKLESEYRRNRINRV
jgi:hypothetical protein